MPVPTSISDLSSTAASNSPAGSETTAEGDNHLRAAYAFIAQLNSDKAPKASPTFTGTVTADVLTTTGNTTLGNASTDTLNVGNGDIVKTSGGAVAIGTSTPISNVPGHVTVEVTGSVSPASLRNDAATAGKYWNIGPEGSSNAFVVYNQDSVGMYMTDGATSWTANSDERIKTAFVPFSNALDKVASLRSGTGRYLSDPETKSRSFLIAQDVMGVLPEAVTEGDGGTLGLAYTDVIPLLVAAIKELKEQLQDLKGNT